MHKTQIYILTCYEWAGGRIAIFVFFRTLRADPDTPWGGSGNFFRSKSKFYHGVLIHQKWVLAFHKWGFSYALFRKTPYSNNKFQVIHGNKEGVIVIYSSGSICDTCEMYDTWDIHQNNNFNKESFCRNHRKILINEMQGPIFGGLILHNKTQILT